MSDKTGWGGRGQQLRDSGWGRQDPVSCPAPSQRKNSALECRDAYIVWGRWEPKRKFRLNCGQNPGSPDDGWCGLWPPPELTTQV